MREILIDGYNLIRQHDRLAEVERRRGLEAGRAELVRLLAAFRARTGDRIRVVFDGDEGLGHVPGGGRRQGISFTFSRPPKSADDVIADRVARAHGKRALLVVSSDRAILAAARRHKVSAVGSGAFAGEMQRRLAEGPEPREATRDADLPQDVAYWERVFDTEERLFEEDGDVAREGGRKR